MILRLAVVFFILSILLFAFSMSQRQQRNQNRVRTIIRSGDDMSIVGDGPWSITPARYPRHERESEPMGM